VSDQIRPIINFAARDDLPNVSAPRTLSLRFARLSVRRELIVYGVAFIVLLVAIVLLQILPFALEPSTRTGVLFLWIILCVLDCWCLHHIWRLGRYGRVPITIDLAEGRIVIRDPVQFGKKDIVLQLTDLERCITSQRARLMQPSLRVHQICFIRRCVQSEVRVAVITSESEMVERAAADLQRTIEEESVKQ